MSDDVVTFHAPSIISAAHAINAALDKYPHPGGFGKEDSTSPSSHPVPGSGLGLPVDKVMAQYYSFVTSADAVVGAAGDELWGCVRALRIMANSYDWAEHHSVYDVFSPFAALDVPVTPPPHGRHGD